MNMFRKNKKGFTLIELIIVIAILAILAAIAIPTFMGIINSANDAVKQSNASNIANAYNAYNALNPNDPLPAYTASSGWAVTDGLKDHLLDAGLCPQGLSDENAVAAWGFLYFHDNVCEVLEEAVAAS